MALRRTEQKEAPCGPSTVLGVEQQCTCEAKTLMELFYKNMMDKRLPFDAQSFRILATNPALAEKIAQIGQEITSKMEVAGYKCPFVE